jgi:hypothetical protein
MQSLKKFTLFLLLTVFVASVGIAPARAQSGLKADIPFDFEIGKTTLKAGTYRVAVDGSFVLLQGPDGKTINALLLPGRADHRHKDEAYLVFTRYSKEAFLNTVAFSVDKTYDLPRSNREKEVMAHVESGEQLAVLIQPTR